MSTHPELQFLDAPALLVEARFRERALTSRLLRAHASRGFTVGAKRGADAPIDPRYLQAVDNHDDNHVLVEASGGGFVVNLSPDMQAGLERTATHLRIPCGEVVFDISASATALAVPRPWVARSWRRDAALTGGIGVVLLLLLALIRSVPADPRALSLDDVGRSVRLIDFRIVPPVPPPALLGHGPAGGGAAPAASGTTGAAGTRTAPSRDGRRATRGSASRQDARAYVHDHTMLAWLDDPRATAFAKVVSDTPALGSDALDVLGHIIGNELADAYGTGLGVTGTGAGGADTGLPLIGGPPGLATIGRGAREGGVADYGHGVGILRAAKHVAPSIEVSDPRVRGGLDKEIVRRVVRQHLNEVRFCYEQSLARRPSLAGRVVTAFTIAPTGRVLVAALQSSSLGEPAAEACIVAATRRWEFPRPAAGGLVAVSYPFQLAPAGG